MAIRIWIIVTIKKRLKWRLELYTRFQFAYHICSTIILVIDDLTEPEPNFRQLLFLIFRDLGCFDH